MACSLPMEMAPVAVAVAPPAPSAARGVRLVAVENLQETGFALALPDTAYAGTLLVGRADLAGGTVVDVDLAAAGGRERRVSRRHARLTYAQGLVTVADWESAHGTWVNKQRLAAGAGAVLADGDELRLADFVFRVELR
ncbi:MAG: domain containing protein [Cyanobacteria bacterium RYN_339]|nr:domain containing protein [Cyanobacteria bacterium RYN_339]